VGKSPPRRPISGQKKEKKERKGTILAPLSLYASSQN
jgi:hypothetical protein